MKDKELAPSSFTLRAPGILGEDIPMRDLSREEVDFCIVGAGAGGGTLGAKLAEAGFSVVILEAGPHWVPSRDFVSDETASSHLFWLDERISSGKDPVEFGSNNSGRGVGGSTVHYSMVKLRLHPDSFRMHSLHGPILESTLVDWPFGYSDLEPFYEEVEKDLQIAGPTFYPWGPRRRRFPQREHELNASAEVFVRGCEKLGIEVAPSPLSTLSAPSGTRPPCVYRGFCNYGCTTNAKSSVLVTYIPLAIKLGAEVRPNCMAVRLEHNGRGLMESVIYYRKGQQEPFRQLAKNIVLAGYAIETPRLLLNSSSSLFPDGLANRSGMVGRNFMVHSGHQVYAKFPDRISLYKAPPPGGALSEQFNGTRNSQHYIGGFTLEVVGTFPTEFAARIQNSKRIWGKELRNAMREYNHYAGIGSVGEVMPQFSNRVFLDPVERDSRGMPTPHIEFSYHENDLKVIEEGKKIGHQILEAAGGRDPWSVARNAHLMGTCRMGISPATSVVNADCQTHDLPNLYICDGSIFPTSGGVNPSLTIQAMAARTAWKIRTLHSGLGRR